MKIYEMQTRLANLLAAASSLTAIAPILVVDGISNLESTIEAALESKGACIAVFKQGGGQNDTAAASRRTLARALIGFVIFEQPSVAHTPADAQLLYDAVLAATSTSEFELVEWEPALREKGGIETTVILQAKVLFG